MHSRSQNKQFKNIHRGRGFISCTGPSLKHVDGTKLNGTVFGLNRGYLKSDIDYDYFLVADKLIAKQYGHEIEEVDATIFTSLGIAKAGFISGQYVWEGDGKRRFQTNFTKKIYGGGTVTFIAMQLAYYMGIQELFLLGCDHYMSHAHSEKISERVFQTHGPDKDHFHENYIEPGDKYFTQDIEKVEDSYRLAREAFESDGRKILNATENSHLDSAIIEKGGWDEFNYN